MTNGAPTGDQIAMFQQFQQFLAWQQSNGAATVTPVKPAIPATKSAKKSQPESLVAAKAHCYEARMKRRSSTKMGGLTAKERSALYATNPGLSAMSQTARAKAWAKIVADYKAGK